MMRLKCTLRRLKHLFYLFSFLVLLFCVIFWLTRRQRIGSKKVEIMPAKEVPFRSSKPKSSSITGRLNVHVWQFDCNFKFEEFLNYPIFPASPHLQSLTNTLDIQWRNTKSSVGSRAQRVFGFVLAPVSGNFKFALSSSSSTELWLSKDKNWQNAQLICKLAWHDVPGRRSSLQNSSEVFLESSRFYFIEILHVGNNSNNHSLQVTWKTPRSKNFEKIPEIYMSSFTEERLRLKQIIREIPLTKYREQSIPETTKSSVTTRKYLHLSEVMLALPSCPYNPGYIGKPVKIQYDTVKSFVNPSYVYPEINHAKIRDGKWIPWFPLDPKIAENVTQKYLKHLEMAYPGKYRLKQILNVEQKPDWLHENPVFYKGKGKRGDRYFLELELWNNERKESAVFSEYIYLNSSNDLLCYPEGMQWNQTAPVYFILSSRNLGKWLWYFIQSIERLYLVTKDENLHVVIHDYNTTDFDVETELKRSSFKNYKVLPSTEETYSKTYSLNRAAYAVTDPHAIVFVMDLHLEIPSSLPNNVRKHCIEGKMFYTPIICRLNCGASPRNPAGHWDPWGYGMFGAYKSDWDRFKGFDEEKFSKRWGGEDWDIIDRAYKVGLEFERIKHPDFYHYHHSKKGLWQP